MLLTKIPAFSEKAAGAARQRQAELTKPAGSLGRLEEYSILLAGLKDQARPELKNKAVIVMAADHGVTVEGVSAFPQEVTPQMVFNFLNGGAAVNALARQAGARVKVVDMGVNFDFALYLDLINKKIAYGTANMAAGPAMTRAQAEKAIEAGRQVCREEISLGLDILALGEMGIGNTTAASAIIAAITGQEIGLLTGRGTGVDDAGLQRKIEVIRKALKVNKPDPQDGFDILCKVGGFEIAGMAGAIIEAAANRIPVVMDGLIASSAALIACLLVPQVKPYLIASHRSVEIGHDLIFKFLEKEPMFNLNMRLGEGSGAVLAFHILEASCRTLNEMFTFAEAGVSGREA